MVTLSDFVVERIQAWGVSRLFAFPGGGIGEFDGALERAERAGHPFRYVRPTHENANLIIKWRAFVRIKWRCSCEPARKQCQIPWQFTT